MTDLERRFITARRNAIALAYKHLNPRQCEGVLATEGPLLLLAGAGSGKTTVLIHRIANLLRYGCGSDSTEIPIPITGDEVEFLEQYVREPDPVHTPLVDYLCAVSPASPWEVLAITFTNKAANELKERLERMLGDAGRDVWASTFHSCCVRILRRDIERLGFSRDFTIYDTDDSKRVIRECLKELSLDEKTFTPREVLSAISRAKDEMLSPDEYGEKADHTGDWRKQRIGKVYSLYVKKLRDANALDFDDIILHTVLLLQDYREVREYYQRKFRYVLIDEYQDTNDLQYRLAALLSGGYHNICVVGDDDQSIYRFRGANIENILNFEAQYRTCRTIRLEQNYRSTQNILDASNAVIQNNRGRKGKTLWTNNGRGEKIVIKTSFNESDEANYVVGQIMMTCNRGGSWKDNAILYRMNAQSNALEYAFKRNGVPYKIIGGTKFFDRAEIKDMLAYLCVINNPTDDLRLRRIINVPSRKIGQATIDKAQLLATEQGVPLYEICRQAERYSQLKSSAAKLKNFTDMIEELRAQIGNGDLVAYYARVCDRTGYIAALHEKDDMESRGRIENVEELSSSIRVFLDNAPENATLAGFLDEVALYTDLDDADDTNDCVVMMTIHSAKGLEFPNIYVVGMEEGVFPGSSALYEQEELEEERRLCYVAMTRAKERLTLTNARQRMLFGRTTPNQPSRFLEELPEETYQWLSKPEPKPEHHWADDFNEGSCGGTAWQVDITTERRRPKPTYSQSVATKAPVPMDLQAGDSVMHSVFGNGLVISVRPMGGDALLEVAFDRVGTKKLMFKAAVSHMTKI